MAAAKKPTPKPTKKGLTVVISKGVTMDPKTGIKTTASPKPKPMPSMKSNKDYFADQKKYIESQKKKKTK